MTLWLSWRRPTWLFLLALASLAIRPQLLWGGSEVGWQGGLHQTLLGFALAVNALHYGLRRIMTWPILALVAAYSLLFAPMRARWRQNAVAAALGLGVVLLAGGLYLPNRELRMFGHDGAVSLSGRDAIWSFCFDQFLISPVFGRGLGSGFIAFADHASFALPTPHNEYLHLLGIGGVVGLALFLGAIGLWSRDILCRVRGDDPAFVGALLP